MPNKPSFVSNLPESASGKAHDAKGSDGDARVEYLEAFNYELTLQLKQLMLEKNGLEEKV